MVRIKFSIVLSLFLTITALKAQQYPVYTQYFFNEYMVNSAIAGTEDYTPLRLTYRDQWSGFSDSEGNNVAPKTLAFSTHTPLSDNMSVGGFLYSDRTGPITQTASQLSIGWRACLSKPSCFWDRKKFISLSLGARALQFSYDDLATTNYNEYFGLQQDPILLNITETDYLLNFTVASYFYTEYMYAGISGQNLFSRALKVETNPDFENMLKPEYNVVLGMYIPISEDRAFAVEPSILTKTTSWSGTQFDISARLIYLDNVWGGLAYRTAQNSYAFMFGMEMGDNMFIGYSYDTSVDGISGYSNGSHEIAFGMKLSTLYSVENVRLKSRFKNRRMLLNPFKRDKNRTDRRGSGS